MKTRSKEVRHKTSKEIEMEVLKVHNLFWESYAKRDVELRFSLCFDDVTFIGSGLHERAKNKEDYKKINVEGIKQYPKPFQINFLWTHITMIDEYVACVESEVVWSQQINDKISKELLRNTTLLKYDNDKWLVMHVHGSVPDYRLKEGDYMTNEQTIIRNRELERQVFERTQDLKKTLEELEFKNRELEIETYLERVRAVALSMMQPSDMVEVCRIISDQLGLLGVDNLRNVQTVIIDEHKSSYLNYQYFTSYKESSIEEAEYNKHPKAREMAETMKKSENAFFNQSFEGEELNKFRDYRTEDNQLPDPLLNNVSSLHFYFYSIGHGALGLSTYDTPLNAESLHLLKRFRNVFELAYRRFKDIEQAVALAKEAKIEASLEKVRSQTMAMQKSDELKEVIQIVYEQFVHLNILVEHTGFLVDYKESDDYKHWIADPHGELSRITIPYFDSIVYNRFKEAIEKGEDFLAINLSFEEKNKFYKKLFEYIPGLTEEVTEFYFGCPGLALSMVLLDDICLYIENFSGIPYTDEENNILMRIGKVFQQTYTRFLDLQRAEAQAREAQIEAALEKIRSRSLAMQKSEELIEVIQVVIQKLQDLGMTMDGRVAGIYTFEGDSKDHIEWVASPQLTSAMRVHVPYFQHPIIDEFLKVHEERGILNKSYSRDLKNSAFQIMYQLPDLRNNPESEREWVLGTEDYSLTIAFEHLSAVGIASFPARLSSDNELSILKRFARVFEQSYIRFLDLKKAEAQAREAQIEASLERVRSKAMAMHNPNDLAETVNVFFKELKTLGINPIRCGVGQIDEASRTTNLTTTTSSQQGKTFQVIGKVKQTGHPVLDGIFDHWKLQKEYFPVLEGEEIKTYYDVMNPQIGYPDYPKDITQFGNSFPFKEGFIFAWTEKKLSEEELQIFRRFTSVLSLTYRRYMDLKEAEEQNKIIQAENDRKTKELEEARQLQLSLLPKAVPELPHLDIAVYMKTASEVGGDYYDFNIQENNVLNIGFGDATGHGLQAGTMITLMKGFFTSDVARFSPKKFLEHCNGIIREIKLGRILMSFSHLRFENNTLLISSAGMPPVYYHRKKNNRTEEIIIQGLPLGAMANTSYKLVEKQLNRGDTILLLTDGLPEQMNNHKVTFDYSRVLKYFDEIADKSSQDIIDRFVGKADEWMNGQQQTDDITFVVIKVK